MKNNTAQKTQVRISLCRNYAGDSWFWKRGFKTVSGVHGSKDGAIESIRKRGWEVSQDGNIATKVFDAEGRP